MNLCFYYISVVVSMLCKFIDYECNFSELHGHPRLISCRKTINPHKKSGFFAFTVTSIGRFSDSSMLGPIKTAMVNFEYFPPAHFSSLKCKH